MSTITVPTSMTGEMVARRAVFLAYLASRVVGMGILQAREGVTEEQTAGAVESAVAGRFNADYVFGRMVKLSGRFTASTVTVSDEPARADYQSWCHAYRTTDLLINAAIASLQAKP